MQVTLANNEPAYTRAKPRLRQSQIDRAQAWQVGEVKQARTAEPKKPWWPFQSRKSA